MRELTLSPRLAALAEWVEAGTAFADVGTDHAYLPVWLLLQGRVSSAIASDLRQGPLDRAQKTAERYGVTGQMSFRLCDGLRGFCPHEAETVAIAGMGGLTIAGILEAAHWTRENTRLLLQPMTDGDVLRRYLQENGYRILRERVARDQGKLYAILEAEGGEMPALSPGEAWAGIPATWRREALRGEYLDALLARAAREKAGVDRSSKASDFQRRAELSCLQAELKEMKGVWQNAAGT